MVRGKTEFDAGKFAVEFEDQRLSQALYSRQAPEFGGGQERGSKQRVR